MSDGCVTVSQCVEGLPIGCFVWELLLAAFLAAFFLGVLNETSPFALGLISTEWAMTQQNNQLLSASLALGTCLSVLPSGYLADRHGRSAVIRTSILSTIGASVLAQSARTLMQTLIARFLVGLASGGLVAVLMPVVAELLPSKKRSFYLTIWCCGKPAGALFVVFLSCLLRRIEWSILMTLTLAPAIFLYLLCRLGVLPESPRHLYLVGRRDEGYNTLLDMYEKEMLRLAWAPDSIGVTCVPAKTCSSSNGKVSTRFAISSDAAVTACLCMVVFSVSAAAQCTKAWQPTLLTMEGNSHPIRQEHLALLAFPFAQAQHSQIRSFGELYQSGPRLVFPDQPDHRVILVLTQGYMLELLGIILCAFISTAVSRKTLVHWSLFFAACFSFGALLMEQRGYLLMTGPLMGAQMIAHSAALNFLLVFACERFPTSCRARAVGIVTLFGQMGRSVMPPLAGLLLQRTSAVVAVASFNCLYILAWLVSLQLPLPAHRERPLHDVCGKSSSEPLVGGRKGSVTYQTV
eukprot:TRINITY_DN49477_c0_g1_i1.p1 TRINITY_DN49477_c0_g1~~TRINITY_DN49477_c0_g1_i1.p1  ORF type:complete len:519 (+),score=37.12 TRINITY_DN49477_c0_g1_i1:224-1780(+)